MIELNLLPDVKKEFLKAQRTCNRVVSGAILTSLVAGGLVAFLATTVYVAQSLMIKSMSDQIQQNYKTLAGKQEINKYLAVQSQLAAVDSVSQQRDLDSRLLDLIPQLNPASPSNVTLYSVMFTKSDKSLLLEGSTGSFEAVNNFRSTLQNAKITYKKDGQDQETMFFSAVDVAAPGMSKANGKVVVAFKAVLTYAPEVFDEHITDVKVVVPKLVTSDGDQNAPKELFGEAPKQETTNGN